MKEQKLKVLENNTNSIQVQWILYQDKDILIYKKLKNQFAETKDKKVKRLNVKA